MNNRQRRPWRPQLTRAEMGRGWVFFALYVLLFPWVMGWVQRSFDGELPVAEANVVYYLLYIWQQLGFDQQKDELYLIGRVPDQEHTLRELHRFLAEVAFIHPAAEFKRAAYARGDADFEIQADFALS